MAIPGVSFEWEDLSEIPSLPSTDASGLVDRPIAMVVFTSDKGPEEWTHRLSAGKFSRLYGDRPSFKRHGQPLLQASNFVNAGGYVTAKRVVASNATLANIAMYATVTKTTMQDVDSAGVPVWTYTVGDVAFTVASSTMPVAGSNGVPSTAVGITPNMIDGVDIEYSFVSLGIGNSNNMEALAAAARADYDNNGEPEVGTDQVTYPLAVFADNGRGVSNKRFRIYMNSNESTPLSSIQYILQITENGEVIETHKFSMNPDALEIRNGVYNSTALEDVVTRSSEQIRVRFFEDIYQKFVENVAWFTGISNIEKKDLLFGYDENQKSIWNINTNGSPDLDSVFGIPLANGSNGEFGDSPATIKREDGMNIVDVGFKAAFSGNTFDGDDIYDLDNNRIDCIFDANYHQEVKRAIEQLVNFREDLMYFRDFGTDCNNIPTIRIINGYGSRSRFIASYANYYQVYDPYTRKKITVTCMYHLSQLFISHFINGRARPFCGQKYNVIIPQNDVVPGSLNFSPKVTPAEDQRRVFDDLRINYLSYYDGNVLTMNTEYTSQVAYTHLSWINNVLAVQEVIKAIRSLCPRIRYSFLDGDDLVRYRKDVQDVITTYANRFATVNLEFVSNAVYDANKIVYAVLRVTFRNFVQTERFKIIALPSA